MPIATYRVQLHAGFTFDHAAAVVRYLAELGVSHLYSSPVLKATAGSTHGYDVVDHSQLNPELGGEAAYQRLNQALSAAGMSHVLDVVPNHMAVAGRANAWWWDVLENGPSSRYAAYFDIDWDPPEQKLRQLVLLPVLGDHYGRVLEAGEIRLVREGPRFVVVYHEPVAPVSPRTLDDLLSTAAESSGSEELAGIAAFLGRLPPATAIDRASAEERDRHKEALGAQLERLLEKNRSVAVAVDAAVERLNADADALDALLSRQNYRLAYWRVAGEELDYRRFFDIPTLIGLRAEDPEVFRRTHDLVFRLVGSRAVSGLRIDHPDGLRDPEQYLDRVQEATGGAYVVVEKILEPGEDLPPSWPVAGTTGYDFLNFAGGLFVDPAGEAALTDFYGEFTGRPSEYEAIAYEKKHDVLREVLAADLSRLTGLMAAVTERHRRYRDYTRQELRQALREVIACFPVYRSYVTTRHVPDAGDAKHIDEAIARARENRTDLDPELLHFLREVLLLRVPGENETELALRFQQLTGPAMAKGVEDTAFYTYNRLVSLNEVGGDPGRFGVAVDAFHQHNQHMSGAWPATMLATATHDTKRGEDVRVRISLLSQMPERWTETVQRWASRNEAHRGGGLPDRNTEYLLYQTLVGAHPLDAERAVAYMEKASREAKEQTSWVRPDETYDRALEHFVRAILDDRAFTDDLGAFCSSIETAGQITSLTQTLLKLTAPGVPDLYQGTELWDLALVDPDNRRPVDFEARSQLLGRISDASPEEVWSHARSGAPKLWLIYRTLALRRQRPQAFAPGAGYEPLSFTGDAADGAVAYTRGGDVAVVAPRFALRVPGGWGTTAVELPPGEWSDCLGGQVRGGGGPVALGELLAGFPVALLART